MIGRTLVRSLMVFGLVAAGVVAQWSTGGVELGRGQ
jgi:hypothetical protein